VGAGYSKSLTADIKDRDPDLPQICGDALCAEPGTLEKAVGSSIVLSAGVGRRFNPNMRADVTLGYRGGYKLDASDQFAPPNHFMADVKSLALMVNVYGDLPLAALTPYVGAGLGVAKNEIGTISLEDGAGSTGTAPGGTKTGLALAFMAGAGIPLGGLTLDVGYRFIDLGKIESGTGDFTIGGVVLTPPYAGVTGKLRAHELTVGLRF
jgi:opacity protein-like surface antigen